MKFLRCENCGSELVKEGENYLCKYCKRSYIDDSLERAYNRLYDNLNATVQGLITEELLNQKMEQIAMHRQSLYKARSGLYSDSQEVGKWAEEILKLCGDDVQANFFAIASKKRWAELNQFMSKINAREVSYLIEGFVEYLTNGRFIERCALHLSDLIARAFDANSEEYLRLNKKLAEAAESEKSGIFDVELPRDVFVAYSSKDKEKAYELVEYLEENDFSCFIASRNLAKGADAELKYNERLKKAMDNCQIFLLVSSKNSRSKNCDAYNIEMRYIKERDISRATNPEFASSHYEEYLEKNRKRCKPRVEYLIEEYGPSIYEKEVKKFFGGLTWQTELDGVVQTVFDYVENQGIQSGDDAGFDKTAETKKMEELIKEFEDRQNAIAKEQEEKRRQQEAFKSNCSLLGDHLRHYRGYASEIEIPEGISSIDEGAFYLNSSLKTLVIPATVKRIGAGAFKECKSLEQVTIQSPEISICDFAFYNCPKLKSVTVESGALGMGAFSKCKALEEITLGEGVTNIGDGAFYDCISLKEVRVPKSVTFFGNSVFAGCKRLETVVLPESLKVLGTSTFSGCKSLKEVALPNNLVVIDKWAFEDCEGLENLEVGPKVALVPTAFNGCTKLVGDFSKAKKEEIEYDESKFEIEDGVLLKYLADEEEATIPDGVVEIGERAFEYKKNLETVNVPESVKKIGKSAFDWCEKLSKMVWAKNCRVLEFDEFAFSCCHRLFSFELPPSILAIGNCVFSNCDALVEVYNFSRFKLDYEFDAVKETYKQHDESKVYEDEDGFVLYKGQKELCLLVYNGKAEHVVIPDGVTEIMSRAFIFHREYRSVLIPESVKKIGHCVFDVYGDEKPVIYARAKEAPWGWTTEYPAWIGRDIPVVWGYQSEEELAIIRKAQEEKAELERLKKEGFEIKGGSLVKYTGENVEVEIPEIVTRIGANAFEGNKKIQKVVLHNWVTEIENSAFSRCENLEKVEIGENVKSIGKNAFSGCVSLKEMVIPVSVTKMGAGVFKDSYNVTVLAESKEVPSGWDEAWNLGNRTVKWGYGMQKEPQKAEESSKEKKTEKGGFFKRLFGR